VAEVTTQDLAGYDAAYYQRDAPEFWFGRYGLPRPDQLAAICYIFGVPFWGTEPYAPRNPGLVVSIGAGEGHLEQTLERMGLAVTGVDPSPGALELYRGGLLVGQARQALIGSARTVIYNESIEHIPVEQTMQVREWMVPGSRLIVVNWPDFHPIEPHVNGWDHITRVDDSLYDRLAAGGTVALRRGSHLVVDVG
jgi:SAM-dependent methyltransferase